MQIFDVRLHGLQLLSNIRGRFLPATSNGGRGGGVCRGRWPVLPFQIRGEDDLLRDGVLPKGEDTVGDGRVNEHVSKRPLPCVHMKYLPETNIGYGQLLAEQVLG